MFWNKWGPRGLFLIFAAFCIFVCSMVVFPGCLAKWAYDYQNPKPVKGGSIK